MHIFVTEGRNTRIETNSVGPHKWIMVNIKGRIKLEPYNCLTMGYDLRNALLGDYIVWTSQSVLKQAET
jgi:hypothetical protein